MNRPTSSRERCQLAEQIFQDLRLGNAELLEGWDGDELQDLRALLTDEEFERLLDAWPEEERAS